VDFWAQHKDFILKILAGVGVFLVALIARSITYGDELEKEQQLNTSRASKIRNMKVPNENEIDELRKDATRLEANARTLAGQVGWDGSDDRLEQKLLRRIVGCTRTSAQGGEEAVQRRAEDFRGVIQQDLNSGFGQLRIMVQQELIEEAREKGIRIGEKAQGIGFEQVTSMNDDERLQYLLQLELVARAVRAAIDVRVHSLDTVQITTQRRRDAAIPGANPEFLQEYEVDFGFTASQDAAREVINRLEAEPPHVPMTELHALRVKRPEDFLAVDVKLLAVVANADKSFAAEEKKP
jgi:hypothetical protein